jgi:hypothetical protein
MSLVILRVSDRTPLRRFLLIFSCVSNLLYFHQQRLYAALEENISPMTMPSDQHSHQKRDEQDNIPSIPTNPHDRQTYVSWQPIHLIALIIMSVLAVIALVGGFLTKEMQPFLTIFSFLSGAVAGIFSGHFGH